MTTQLGSAPITGAGPDPADVERMRGVVTELAKATYAGRRVGSNGGRLAAAWLADALRGMGASVRYDEFDVTGVVREVYAIPTLEWGSTTLVFRRDFCEHLASADLPSIQSGHLAASDATDTHGAWVLAPSFDATTVSRFADGGAVGVLVPRGIDAAGWMPKMIAGPATAALPVLAVRSDLHELMTRTGPRTVRACVPLRTLNTFGKNVYADFRPDRDQSLAVLLTAHLDGVGDDPDGTRFPAAADNASGVAVVLAAARQLHDRLPAGARLGVALLDAEEVGALGSAHHAPAVAAGTYVLNVDGAAALDGAVAVEAGGPADALLAALDRAGRANRIPLRAGAMPSDNRRYAAAGLPAIGLGMGIPGYQTPAETPELVQSSTLAAAVRLVVATAEHLANRAATS